MNKSLHRIAGLILGVFSQSLMALDLSVVHTGNWPPYAAKELPGQGLAVELVTTALQNAGYTVHLRVDSLDRIVEGIKLGVYDVFATPWYSDARNRYLDFSDPYLESTIRFIKRKETDFKYTGLAGLKGMTVGVVQDYAYDPAFSQAHDFNKISERNLIQNLLKLTQRRVQLTLDDELVLQYEINRFMPRAMENLELVQRPLALRGVHIGVSRENPEHAKIVADFNKAIKEMINDGSYSGIMQKHKAYIEHAAE
ncbi:MAG: transporter substrate-binding domain-containing protein [Pseudomonadota bacterium]|nr:transporter substrate-binding domain-containing protein [Pseudomonadota bacterium]